MQLETNSSMFFDNEFVKIIADEISIGTINDQICETVLYHVGNAIKQALVFAKENSVACARTDVGMEDVRFALKDLGITMPFGFDSEIGRRLKHDTKIAFDKTTELYDLTELRPEPLDEIIDADVAVAPHWLVIDGVQPRIPENPIRSDAEYYKSANKMSNNLLLKEVGKKLPKTEHVQVKTIATHTVSLEQQVYFKEIMETVMCADEGKRMAALSALKTDPGLQVLIPRFCNAVSEGVRCNLIQENVAFLIYLMRIMDALVLNPNVNLEKCLHDIVPAITSCLVIRSIGSEVPRDPSWTLRDFCGKLMMKILTKYKVPQVRIRILRVFSNVFQCRDPSLPSLYAVSHAIHLFGVEAVENILFPNLGVIKNAINKSMTGAARNRVAEDAEEYGIRRITDLVVKLMKNYALSDRMPEKTLEHCRVVFGPFGDEIYDMIS